MPPRGCPPSMKRRGRGAGAWSLSELVASLLDSDLVALADRMKRVISETDPVLEAFDENAWIEQLDSQSLPIEEAVALFAANRRWITRVLHNCVASHFAQSGVHAEAGRMASPRCSQRRSATSIITLVFLYGKRATLGIAVPPRYTALKYR